jgi:hypothetical protein
MFSKEYYRIKTSNILNIKGAILVTNTVMESFNPYVEPLMECSEEKQHI